MTVRRSTSPTWHSSRWSPWGHCWRSWWCWFWFAKWRGRDLTVNRWFLRFMVIAGPMAIIALECGWIATEVGRQPWTVWQVLRTTDAASTSTGLWWSYAVAFVVYIGMTIGAFIVLRGMARRWREGETDLPTPYGPEKAVR